MMDLRSIDAIAVRVWFDQRLPTRFPANVLSGFEATAGGTFFNLTDLQACPLCGSVRGRRGRVCIGVHVHGASSGYVYADMYCLNAPSCPMRGLWVLVLAASTVISGLKCAALFPWADLRVTINAGQTCPWFFSQLDSPLVGR